MTAPDLIVLDGGMGVELRNRGIDVPRTVWSADALVNAPEAVVEVHRDYGLAGADVITTNNYGVIPEYLAKVGWQDRLLELTGTAARLAVAARDDLARHGIAVRVAGCLPPLVESYRADLVRPDAELAELYAGIAETLAPHVDLFLCETMALAREARGAARAAAATRRADQDVWVAWTLADDAPARLRSGEDIAAALAALDGLPVAAVGFNCSRPEVMAEAIGAARALCDLPLAVYANTFTPVPADFRLDNTSAERHRRDLDAERYAAFALDWRNRGASIIGGCCGIGPDHIRALATRLAGERRYTAVQ